MCQPRPPWPRPMCTSMSGVAINPACPEFPLGASHALPNVHFWPPAAELCRHRDLETRCLRIRGCSPPEAHCRGHRGTIPSQATSRQRASAGTSDGRHVVTKRAGHRPGLRTFGNRCLRILSVLQSRISAAFETCRRTWSSTRTTLHKHGQARPLSPDGVAVKLGSFS